MYGVPALRAGMLRDVDGHIPAVKSVIRVAPLEAHTSYAPYTCFQCAEAWCMAACPVDVITIAPTTEAKVVIDDGCTGCKLCTIACPYGTMFLDLDRRKAFKYNLCNGGPACAACPVDATEWVEAPVDWSPRRCGNATPLQYGAGFEGALGQTAAVQPDWR